MVWKGFGGWDGPDQPDNDHYRGGLRPDQLAFVANYLHTVPREDLVVLAMHIPLEKGASPQVVEQPELMRLLSSHPKTLSISGHSHRQAHSFLGAAEGYAPEGGGEHHHLNLGAASGSWYRGPLDANGLPDATMRDGTPPGFSLLRFEGTSYSARYRVARRDVDYQMNIAVPFELPQADVEGTEVVVNVFAGSVRSEVRMRLGASEWIPLDRVRRFDPLYVMARKGHKQLGATPWRELPPPTRSTPLWAGVLPGGVPPGPHRLEVESTDVFGQVHRGFQPILVLPAEDDAP